MWLWTALGVLVAWPVISFPLAVAVGRSFMSGARPTEPDERVARELVGG